MFSWENPDDRVAIVQMNAQLRHAQLELLSAQCATHQLRLRYATEDVARYAEQDVLRKAIEAATSLHEYYRSIRKHISGDASPQGANLNLPDEHIWQAATRVLAYLEEQRERYSPRGNPLSPAQKTAMRPFFSAGILDRTKIVESKGERVPTPSFYPDAKAMGFLRLPEITHMPSLTFIDLIVFNEGLNDRFLFHGLVHAVQFQILGAEKYAELFVRAFFRAGSHLMVPLEAHAFALDSRFARNPADSFSVEDQIRLWIREERY
jgi:hypothetical protein